MLTALSWAVPYQAEVGQDNDTFNLQKRCLQCTCKPYHILYSTKGQIICVVYFSPN